MRKSKFFQVVFGLLFLAALASGQTGGAFTVEKSIVAAGGGAISGGAFTLGGTAGQTIAGGFPQGAAFTLYNGFWSPAATPTAANVSVSGNVLTPTGGGLTNAIVVMTDMNGSARTARTNAFGFYRFEEVEAGQTYIFEVRAKSYRFVPQVVVVMEGLDGLNFTSES